MSTKIKIKSKIQLKMGVWVANGKSWQGFSQPVLAAATLLIGQLWSVFPYLVSSACEVTPKVISILYTPTLRVTWPRNEETFIFMILWILLSIIQLKVSSLFQWSMDTWIKQLSIYTQTVHKQFTPPTHTCIAVTRTQVPGPRPHHNSGHSAVDCSGCCCCGTMLPAVTRSASDTCHLVRTPHHQCQSF